MTPSHAIAFSLAAADCVNGSGVLVRKRCHHFENRAVSNTHETRIKLEYILLRLRGSCFQVRKQIDFPRGVINYSRFKVMVGAGTFTIDCKNSSSFCRLYSRIWLWSKKKGVWLMWPKWQRNCWPRSRPNPTLDKPSCGLTWSEQTWLFSLLFSHVGYAGCLHKWAPSLQWIRGGCPKSQKTCRKEHICLTMVLGSWLALENRMLSVFH